MNLDDRELEGLQHLGAGFLGSHERAVLRELGLRGIQVPAPRGQP